MSDTEDTNADKLKNIPSDILADARTMIDICSEAFEYPVDALFAGILVVAVLAKGAGMPLETLVEGISSAYQDLDPLALGVGAEVVHDGRH